MDQVTVISGAGISAESGIKTFRDADGLWEGHDVMEVASPIGWANNQELVLDFYNQRRRQLKAVNPNKGHKSLVRLEKHYKVSIITQNVDNLHERAGSSNVMHLHGQLNKVRSTGPSNEVLHWENDLILGDLCSHGYQLRPHIVWFGEQVPMIENAIEEMFKSSICIVVGTSLQVYPAAGLISYLPKNSKIYFVDPKPVVNHELSMMSNELEIHALKATEGLPLVVDKILKSHGHI